MILKNPTDNDITVQIKGDVLTVKANATVEVTEAQGEAWKLVHEFLQEQEAPVKVAKAPAPVEVPSASVASAPVTPKK